MASRDTTESIEAKPKSALYTRAPTRPQRPRSEARPAEGRKRANVPRRAPPTGRARRLPEAHTMAGRGSAERSRAARPRWVMMEISRVARASTAERSGSSSGACCRRNDKTSDPSRSRASSTKGVSSACGFFSGGYRLRCRPPARAPLCPASARSAPCTGRLRYTRWRKRRRRSHAYPRRPCTRRPASPA